MMYDRLQSEAMPLTHEFLSMMLGVRRSRVTESAGELQRLGLIRYYRGRVNILDHATLIDDSLRMLSGSRSAHSLIVLSFGLWSKFGQMV